MKKPIAKNSVVLYQASSGEIQFRGDFSHETIWATQAQIAEVFGVSSQNVTMHIKNIYKEKELEEKSTCKKSLQVQNEGKRTVKRQVNEYNLDVIIAVGYRISSVVGTHFRKWVTKTLREYITKGYVLNKKQLKKNHTKFVEIKKPPVGGFNCCKRIRRFQDWALAISLFCIASQDELILVICFESFSDALL
jgi:hypothetical protein